MSDFKIRLTDDNVTEWFDIEFYDDFEEMAEEFVDQHVSEEFDDIDDYINEKVYIDCFDDQFWDEYEGLGGYYSEPTGESFKEQGIVYDWNQLKEDVEILQEADKEDMMRPLLIYHEHSSCADLEQAWYQLRDAYQGNHDSKGGFSNGANFAMDFYSSNYSEVRSAESCGLVIDWEETWDNMSMDYWEEDGYVFRVI